MLLLSAAMVVLAQAEDDAARMAPAFVAHKECRRLDAEPPDASCATAREHYRAFLAEHPTGTRSDDLRFFLAELEYDTHRYAAAAPLYREVAASAKWGRMARYNLVLDLDAARRGELGSGATTSSWDSAFLDACDDFVSHHADQEDARNVALSAAKVAFSTGRVADAERRWAELRARWPGSIQAKDALSMQARALVDEGAYPRLIALLRGARAADAKATAALVKQVIELSRVLAEDGRLSDAAALAEHAGHLGDDPAAALLAVKWYLKVGERDQASAAGRALVQRWPRSREAAKAKVLGASLQQGR